MCVLFFWFLFVRSHRPSSATDVNGLWTVNSIPIIYLASRIYDCVKWQYVFAAHKLKLNQPIDSALTSYSASTHLNSLLIEIIAFIHILNGDDFCVLRTPRPAYTPWNVVPLWAIHICNQENSYYWIEIELHLWILIWITIWIQPRNTCTDGVYISLLF